MSTDIKISKKFSQVVYVKKAIIDLVIPFARDNLPRLVSNLASNSINKFKRKISGKGAARAGNGFTLYISNEDIINIIKFIKSFENSNVLTDGIIETVKHEIKKNKTVNFFLLC